jgi:hypothetical protein
MSSVNITSTYTVTGIDNSIGYANYLVYNRITGKGELDYPSSGPTDIANSSAVSFNGANVGKAYFGSSVVFRDRNMMNGITIDSYYDIVPDGDLSGMYDQTTGVKIYNSNPYDIKAYLWQRTDTSFYYPSSISETNARLIPANGSNFIPFVGATVAASISDTIDKVRDADAYNHLTFCFADEEFSSQLA